MPNSLRCKLSKLRFQGEITQEEYKELIDKLEGHDQYLRDMYEPKWIPVEERLPENNGTYLVWDIYGYQISDFNAEEQTFGFMNYCTFDYETGEVYPPRWVEHDTVIAWMPLPASYQPPKMMCEED